MTMIHSVLSGVGPFFLLLGLLVFVHELGHFLVAKFFNVRVETFSLGFGKKLVKYQYGETTYALSLIPLGGYVKMFGDDPSAEVPVEQRDRAFLHKPVFQRVAVVLAGPLMNLLFAFVVFTLIGTIGEDQPGPFVGDVATDSAAYAAGFRPGDRITKINAEDTPTWTHVKALIEQDAPRVLDVTVERPGESAPLHLAASTQLTSNENVFSRDRRVGEVPGLSADSRGLVVGLKSSNGPAAKAGVRSLDLITQVGDRKVTYFRELAPALEDAQKLGSTVEVRVRDVAVDDTPTADRILQLTLPKGELSPDALGLEPAELYILHVQKGSPAERAGVRRGDRVIKVDGADVNRWDDVLEKVKGFDSARETLKFGLLREGRVENIDIKPEMTKMMSPKGQEEKRFTVGILSGMYPVGPEPVHYRVAGAWPTLKHGLFETYRWSELIVMGIVRMIQGEVSPKNVSGVITIGRVASHSFAAGLSVFLKTMAIISLNLFLLNLLPVPVLDGGHLVFFAIEGVKGAPLSLRKMEIAQQIGLMLLMFLMLFAFFNDITNLFAGRW